MNKGPLSKEDIVKIITILEEHIYPRLRREVELMIQAEVRQLARGTFTTLLADTVRNLIRDKVDIRIKLK
jgi:hypothetical protein